MTIHHLKPFGNVGLFEAIAPRCDPDHRVAAPVLL